MPREAGTIFARTRSRLAVYSHIVPLSSDQIPRTARAAHCGTREKYDEPLEIGEDLRRSKSLIPYGSSGWSALSVDGPDLSPNSPFAVGMCGPFSAPMTAVRVRHQGAGKQGVANLAIPAGDVLEDNFAESII